ncbi:MAG: alpha/beta fold hydrolase [Planctomycetota bacterium]
MLPFGMAHPNAKSFAVVLLTLYLNGCALHRPYFRSAEFAKPQQAAALQRLTQNDPLRQAESFYAQALEKDRSGNAECIEEYLYVAQLLWPTVSTSHDWNDRSNRLYQSAVGKLLTASQRFEKFNPVGGIESTRGIIPVRYNAMVWPPSECRHYTVIGDYRTDRDIVPKRQAGLGVPILGQHACRAPFIFQDGLFTATAIVRPNAAGQYGLEIVNSPQLRRLDINGQSTPLAFDLTAPIAYLTANQDHSALTGFLRPAEVESTTGLQMVEPYQPGKIPIILIHGLASDPLTWSVMANELFYNEDIIQRYQVWVYSYPTGKPFPTEAARLRDQLVQLRELIDPTHVDSALDQIVLLGHSMGGLISKLQVTTSGDELAHVVFGKPLSELTLTDEMRDRVTQVFHFQPSRQIKRVVFMGTPHQGSKIASNPIGRLASHIVKEPIELITGYDELIRLNGPLPIGNRIPTSVDLLRPDDPLLQAIYHLPVAPHVALHTVLGVSHGGHLGIEESDGVVPKSSAQHPNTQSEVHVDANHTRLHHTPEAVKEVVRILRAHAG